MSFARQRISLVFCCSATLLVLTVGVSTAMASAGIGSINGTVSATTSDASARPTLLGGARLTLVNRDLPDQFGHLFNSLGTSVSGKFKIDY
jgi:hypothetical protein